MSLSKLKEGIDILHEHVDDEDCFIDTSHYEIQFKINVDWDTSEELEEYVPEDVIEELDELGFHRE
jgi:hypothetical protein